MRCTAPDSWTQCEVLIVQELTAGSCLSSMVGISREKHELLVILDLRLQSTLDGSELIVEANPFLLPTRIRTAHSHEHPQQEH